MINPQTPARSNDMLARLCVYILIDIAIFAGLMQFHSDLMRAVLLPCVILQSVSMFRFQMRTIMRTLLTHNEPRARLPNRIRFSIMKRDRYRCRLCGRKASGRVVLEVDHRVPVSRGGSNKETNLWTLCSICNSGKSDSYL